jgi:hypothetical protein
MKAEYELIQIISKNRDAILEDCRKYKTSTFNDFGGLEYFLDNKTLQLSATFSQEAYETTTYIQDGVREPIFQLLGYLKDALALRPEHAQVWSSEPLPSLGSSKLRTKYYAKTTENAFTTVFGGSRSRVLVESHGMVQEYVIGEADFTVTVFARWKELSHHCRTVRFAFPEPNATTLADEFAMAEAFAAEVVKGTHELIADNSYWPSLKEVQKCERQQAMHLVMNALDTLNAWQCDTVLKHPAFMEKALKLWIQEQAEKTAQRAQQKSLS